MFVKIVFALIEIKSGIIQDLSPNLAASSTFGYDRSLLPTERRLRNPFLRSVPLAAIELLDRGTRDGEETMDRPPRFM